MPAEDGSGKDLFDEIYTWIAENEPQFLANVSCIQPLLSSKEALRNLLDNGDVGSWLTVFYRKRTQRDLEADLRVILSRWLEHRRRDRSWRVEFLPKGPQGSWTPVTDAALGAIEPKHLKTASSCIDFQDRRHRVRIVPAETETAPPSGRNSGQRPSEAATEPVQVAGINHRKHRGGRPPVLSEAVASWYDQLPLEDQELSNSKLAAIWKSDPSHPGDEQSVRQIIGKLRRSMQH